MKSIKTALRRPIYGFAALVVTAGVALSGFLPGLASASTLTSRAIKISDSTPDASGVTYDISFTETAATVVKGITVDFCAESPLNADTCTVPAGFDINTGTALSTQTGTDGSWTLSNKTAGHIQISGLTANSAAAMDFVVTGVHNPTASGIFYARIYAYANAPDYTNVTAPGTVRDFGGIALNSVTNIQVTAKVMESITICVSSVAFTGNSCAGSLAPNIIIGHGSPTKALDSTVTDTADAYTQIGSNATGGVIVRLKNSNSCGGLSKDGGATCGIAPVGATAAAIAAGNALFGLRITASTLETGGSGSMTPVSPYNDAANYGMDASTVNDNVTSTYGDTIMSTSAPLNGVDNHMIFAASAATTTPAGIYTANMDLIGTGTF